MRKWFNTWNKFEYKEWAREIKGGYSLVIIRKEPKRYLCVKAKLLMKEKGLPDFKVIEERYLPTEKEAKKQIQDWEK